jgi:hypothetical protein
VNPYDNDPNYRVVRVTWDQIGPYVWDFEDVTPPAGMNVSSVIGNPPP